MGNKFEAPRFKYEHMLMLGKSMPPVFCGGHGPLLLAGFSVMGRL